MTFILEDISKEALEEKIKNYYIIYPTETYNTIISAPNMTDVEITNDDFNEEKKYIWRSVGTRLKTL